MKVQKIINYVDTNTGECLRTFCSDMKTGLSQEDRPVNKYPYGEFIWVKREVGSLFMSDLADSDLVKCVMLATFVRGDGELTYCNGKPIKPDKIASILKSSLSETYTFLSWMKKSGIMECVDDIYKFTNRIFIKGALDRKILKQENKDGFSYVRLNIDSYRSMYNDANPHKRRTISGFLRVLPFLSRKNVLGCYELNFSQYDDGFLPLDIIGLTELFKVDVGSWHKIKSKLESPKFIYKGEICQAVKFLEDDETGTYVVIDPRVASCA